jgi:serine/threonine protein kinase
MPAPASATDYLSVLRRSQLVPEHQLESVATLLEKDPSLETPERIGAALVRYGIITKFQSRQLAQGRYKRFTIAEKYRLLEHIGTGGMGAVYLCEHMLMQRLVAVKVLPIDKIANDPSALQRFVREARAVASLDHPNIVHAYDIDKFDKVHYLVMEYVDGTSLQEIVARYATKKQWFSIPRAAHAIAQAALGLQHAHELSLIHRDVKPGNLLLDRFGTIKVLDLGLARFHDHRHDDLTKQFDENCVLGTADYLSPEQATMEVVDGRADIYGLGGTLYFLLTGSSPYPDGTIAQKLVAHQKSEPKPIQEFRDDVPPELIAIVKKMMAKNPEDRFQSCGEVIAALEPWTSEPIDLPPPEEMPDLCPAVIARMEASSGLSRSGSGKTLSGISRGLPRSGGSRVKVDSLTSKQALVPTARSTSTLPIPKPQTAPTPPQPVPPPVPAPVPATLAKPIWPLLVLVGSSSFLLATVLVSALFLLLR